MSEKLIQDQIMLEVGKLAHVRLFRNHTGKGVTGNIIKSKAPGEWLVKNGRMCTFGLSPDSPDTVGWETITVTPAMVGQKLAVMLMIEVKGVKGRLSPGQQNFITLARSMGCKVLVCRSAEEAVAGIVNGSLV